MTTLDATVGGASSNSYATMDEADSYMEGRLNSTAWTGEQDDDRKAAAMIEAARELTNCHWIAQRTFLAQALAWPQRYCLNPDAPAITGITDIAQLYFDPGLSAEPASIPTRVKNAQIELAFEFLKAGTTDIAVADKTAGIIEKTIDVLTTRWQPYQRPQGLARYPRVVAYIAPMLAMAAGGMEISRS